jgi:fructose-bisphosphate aldolase class II
MTDAGGPEEMGAEMVAYADGKGWKKGDYKSLNLPFENKLLAQPAAVRERMSRGVEEFAFKMMTGVFNAKDTAPLGVDAILKAGSFDLGPEAARIEDPKEWTEAKIVERAKTIASDKGAKGNFDD